MDMEYENTPLKKKLLLFALLVVGSVGLVQLIGYFTGPSAPRPSTNRLLLGKAAAEDVVRVSLIKPQSFSGLTRNEILSVRRTAVAQAGQSLLKGYEPSEYVFNTIQNGLGWFSLPGFFYSGAGPKATEGLSSESRFILNPFLLVAPEFWGLSIWAQKNLKWDKGKITESMLSDGQFPLAPKPESLEWHPKARYAEVTYRISDYLRRVNEWTLTPLALQHADFGIVAYNAADMGLDYLLLNLRQSKNITNAKQPTDPEEIFESVGAAGTLCGVSEGCNHRLSPSAAFDSIKITALPAEAVFNLWSSDNNNLNDPNLNFIVKFE